MRRNNNEELTENLFVQSLLRRAPLAHIQLFGNEPYEPYNRVQVSALLAGEVFCEALDIPLRSLQDNPNFYTPEW